MLRLPLLGSVLEDAILFAEHFATKQILLQRQPQRLFDVDILAGLGSQQGDRYMPMIGRGDNDSVDVFSVEDAAKVGIGRAIDRRGGRIATILEAIRHGKALDPASPLGCVHQKRPASSHADMPQRHAFAWWRRFGVAQSCGRNDNWRSKSCRCCTTGFEHITTREFLASHHRFSW